VLGTRVAVGWKDSESEGGLSAYSIATGEVTSILADFVDNAFDGLLCDPPYGFSFMNKAWDYDVPSVALWRECLRVLKPGAPLLAFGGARTYHRLACAIEDAGFELRDCLMWLYGKGFPKSVNVGLVIDKAAGATREIVGARVLTGNAAISTSEKGGTYGVQVGSIAPKEIPITAPASTLAKQWHGWGTALKPAYEPILLARKPLDGTIAQNVARWGVGGLAIDGCRIGEIGGTRKSDPKKGPTVAAYGNGLNGGGCKPIDGGRWPANLILDENAAALLDAEVGQRPSTPFRENVVDGNVLPFKKRTAGGYGDAGGPSRFFYTAKVSTREREAGCDGLPLKSSAEMTERSDDDAAGTQHPRAGAGGSTGGARNFHPTLKPIALTTWLARLIRPPQGAVLLVPFAGTGSEMIGALKAEWNGVFGIEREAEYVTIAKARLAHWAPESEAA
jgi:site-specific DNA-methyltransferase (adenine-specific)